MLYHQTKDVLYVKEKLGHRNINSTLIYIQIADAIFQQQNDTYHCKTAKTLEEAIQLCEKGWNEWSEVQGVKIYRKRK
jgi:LPS sulfotransferase NodH